MSPSQLLSDFKSGKISIADVKAKLDELKQKADLSQGISTHADNSKEVCVHELFEQQVHRNPTAIAAIFEDDNHFEHQLTYEELDRKSTILARYLQKCGVKPDSLVAICVERSPEMLVGLLGIQKSGGAYVPLDPGSSSARMKYMLEDSQATIFLTQSKWMKKVSEVVGLISPIDRDHQKVDLNLVPLDEKWNHIVESVGQTSSTSNQAGLRREVTAVNLVYVNYPSENKELSKGIGVTHQAVVNFFKGMDRKVGGTSQDTLMSFVSIPFDNSVLELLWALSCGAKLLIIEKQGKSQTSVETKPSDKPINFSLFFFSSQDSGFEKEKYRLLLEGAKIADKAGFAAIWTPERHFHEFGGLFPSPSVTNAALSTITQQIQLRAGSVVLPLQNPIRVAEEWSVIDNLSQGRVGISVAPGWQINDFTLAPHNYENRRSILEENLSIVRQLWRGEAIDAEGVGGKINSIQLFPKPFQSELPIWLATGGNPESFRKAGQLGMHVLTALLGQTLEDVAQKVQIYREARENAGYSKEPGKVALMLHTYVGESQEEVKQAIKAPFIQYLRSNIGLIKSMAASLDPNMNPEAASKKDLDDILEIAFYRYSKTAALFGTVESCLETINHLKKIGVDEVACLIDFGVPTKKVLKSLKFLSELKDNSNIFRAQPKSTEKQNSMEQKVRQHNVTLLQGTPHLINLFFPDLSELHGVKTLLLGREALPFHLAENLLKSIPAVKIRYMDAPTEATVVDRVPTKLPLSNNIQEGLSFGFLAHHNVVALVDLPHSVNLPALEEAFKWLVKTHDTFRIRFFMENESLRQVMLDTNECPFSIEKYNISELSEDQKFKEIEDITLKIQSSFQFKIDSPLIRVAHIDLGEDEPGRIFICIHHFIIDGYSFTLLGASLETIYNQILNGEKIFIENDSIPVEVWLKKQYEYANSEAEKELGYWSSIPWERFKKIPSNPGKNYPPSKMKKEEHNEILRKIFYHHNGVSNLDEEEFSFLCQRMGRCFFTLSPLETDEVLKTKGSITSLFILAIVQAIGELTGSRALFLGIYSINRFPPFNVRVTETVGSIFDIIPFAIDLSDVQTIEEQLKKVNKSLSLNRKGLAYRALKFSNVNPDLKETIHSLPNPEIKLNINLGNENSSAAGFSSFCPESKEFPGMLTPKNSEKMLNDIPSLNLSIKRKCLFLRISYQVGKFEASIIQQIGMNFMENLRELSKSS